MKHAPDTFAYDMFTIVLAFIIIGLSYFVPTIVAFFRRHPRRGSIFFLNVILGWTGVVWLYLTLMAMDFV